MPLSGSSNIYEEFLSVTPGNATGVAVTWSVDGGYIVSGQNSTHLQYKWNPVNGAPVVRSVSVLAQNECSEKTQSKSYTICDPIISPEIIGPSSIVSGEITQHNLQVQSGYPTDILWSVVSSASVAANIMFGNNTNTDVFINSNINSGYTSGEFTLLVEFKDCDGNPFSVSKIIQVQQNCIPMVSISF